MASLLSWERLKVGGLRLALLAALIAIWEFAPDRILPQALVSRPESVVEITRTWIDDGRLQDALFATLESVGRALLWGAALAIPLALATHLFRWLEDVVRPFITWGNALPKFLLMPIMIAMFGLSRVSMVILAAAYIFFVFYYYAFAGMRTVSEEVQNSLRLIGAGRLWIARHALMPGAGLALVTALRVVGPLGFTAVIFAEIFIGNSGLGALIAYSRTAGDPAGAVAGIIVTALVAVALDTGFRLLERRVGRWQTAGGQ